MGTFAHLTFHSDIAPHHLTESLCQCQSQTSTAILPSSGSIRLSESLKYFPQLFPAHANASIADLKANPISIVVDVALYG